jgi:hypothetical protein
MGQILISKTLQDQKFISNAVKIDIGNTKTISDLFCILSLKLEFEVPVKKSWDAFLDQFRQFLRGIDTDTVIEFLNYKSYQSYDFDNAITMIDTILFAVHEYNFQEQCKKHQVFIILN